MAVHSFPVLRPSVLVLTKMKHAAQWIGSTRPQSIRIMAKDVSDISFLMQKLAAKNDAIDFENYGAADVQRLCSACRSMVTEWRRIGNLELVERMSKVLREADRQLVLSEVSAAS